MPTNCEITLIIVPLYYHSFVELHYNRVKDYFDLEPSLQKLFVHVTPKGQFSALCKSVPPYLVTDVLVQRTMHPGPKTQVSVKQYYRYHNYHSVHM